MIILLPRFGVLFFKTLKTYVHLNNIKRQFTPRREHSPCQLQRATNQFCFGKQSVFTAKIIGDT
jgi:hypothetical protein